MTDRSAACWVLVFFLGLYAFTAGGHYGGDGFWSYLTAESIVRDGDLIPYEMGGNAGLREITGKVKDALEAA